MHSPSTASGNDCRIIELEGAELRLWPTAWHPSESAKFFAVLRQDIDWRQEEVTLFGRRHTVPRLVAWHGDPGAHYTYSGTGHAPHPWTPELVTIRRRVRELTGADFNAVLLNLYRDGRDGMGWHADDEPELGPAPLIASVSLGAPRRFRMRHRRRRERTLNLDLEDGSLLLMGRSVQHHWLHALPKTSQAVGERINLTFRQVTLT
jgi:alkylated DNA repair dioxygenase AlkB